MATHNTLGELFTAIANAIRGKTGSTDPIVADEFPTAITNIETGVDTSDATATAEDIAGGVTAYVNGEKVEGTLPDFFPSTELFNTTATFSNYFTSDGRIDTGLVVTGYYLGDNGIIRGGNEVSLGYPSFQFGDATAADVIAGKTFTSSAGIKVAGTASAGAKVVYGTTTLNFATGTFYISCDFNPSKIFAVYTGSGNISNKGTSIYTDSNGDVYCMSISSSLQMSSKYVTKSYRNGEITLTYNNGFATGTWYYILTE